WQAAAGRGGGRGRRARRVRAPGLAGLRAYGAHRTQDTGVTRTARSDSIPTSRSTMVWRNPVASTLLSARDLRFLLYEWLGAEELTQDRKSTRLNSSHVSISYAVFCLKKKRTKSHKTTNTIYGEQSIG